MCRLSRLPLLLLLVVVALAQAAGRDLTPASDSQVIETLPARVRSTTSSPEIAAVTARQAITLARQTADTRYLGRAQAMLAPWWDKKDAPVELVVLQATVLQSRHEFDAARVVLNHALKREPSHAQGWLTLATLERLSGNYPAALLACDQVARAGAVLYAQACKFETVSLQGGQDQASRGLKDLQRQTTDASTQAWLMSLQAENDERAGRDLLAWAGYQASLARAQDGYTALAAADLLLRTQRPLAAKSLLAGQPNSDAVLIRRALAAKRLQDPGWQAMVKEVRERFAALELRGDNPATHAREQALVYLWLDDDGARALQTAKLNLTLQKEPFDWWLAMASASLAGQDAEMKQLRAHVTAIGLSDARLSTFQAKRVL
jgi:hypothetical protein